MATIGFVARDFDAAIQYWQMQTERTQGAAFLEAKSKLARAKSDHAYARSLTAKATECEWFSIQSEPAFQHVTPSDGPWAEDLDREGALYPVAGTLKLAEQTEYGLKSEVLLGSEETPLIVRITDEYDWPNGQILVLLNGTTVLNLPLVKHENRKLAAKLMAACGDDVRRVTFLESGPMGMRISNSDPNNYSGLEALSVWPVNSILLHLIVAGILFCGMVFPIFGRPRQFEEDTTSDFGKHIRAMGELLAISQDRRSAVSKVQQYRALEIEPIVVDSDNPPQETGNPFKVSRA